MPHPGTAGAGAAVQPWERCAVKVKTTHGLAARLLAARQLRELQQVKEVQLLQLQVKVLEDKILL